MYSNQLVKNLKRYLKQANMGPTAFSLMLGFKKDIINDILKGKRLNPPLEVLKTIATVLRKPLADLLGKEITKF
jgi:transcriptional regulator with XRE-family HTH domain